MDRYLNYNVGDTIYAFYSKHSDTQVMEGKVIKVTPTGRISAQFPPRYHNDNGRMAFMPSGRQVGGDIWSAWWIEPKDKQEARYQIMQAQVAELALRHKFNVERNELSRIPFNKTNKADLLKQLDVLQAIINQLE